MIRMLMILCLTALTGCSVFCQKPIVEYKYIEREIPASPAEPGYFPVSWATTTTGYELDSQNAKNLLKNVELMKAHRDECLVILDGLRSK